MAIRPMASLKYTPKRGFDDSAEEDAFGLWYKA